MAVDADFKWDLQTDSHCLQSDAPGCFSSILSSYLIPGSLPAELFDSAAVMSGSAVRLLESGKLRPLLQLDFCHNKVFDTRIQLLIYSI